MINLYSVAVRLSVVGGAAQAVMAITGQMNALNNATNRTQRGLGAVSGQLVALKKSLAEIRALGLAGGVLAAGGGGILGLLGAPLKAANEYDLAFARFKTLGLGKVVNEQADAFARGTNVFGSSATDLMDTMREMASFFGSMDVAKQIAPTIAALNAANAGMFGGKVGAIGGGEARSIMRFADMIGATGSPTELMRALDIAQKAVTSSGGAMKFGDMEQVAKYGGVAAKSLSGEGWFNLFSVMQEMGGARTGTALQSLYTNAISGRMSKQAMGSWVDLGLGSIVQEKIGEVGGKAQTRNRFRLNQDVADAMAADPFGAFQKFVLPAIQKKHGTLDTGRTLQLINDMFSNRTGANLGGNFATQFLQIIRDANLGKGAMGVQATIDTYGKTSAGNLAELQKKWNTLLAELGVTILPMAIKGLESLTMIAKQFTAFAQEWPTLTKSLLVLSAALGGLAVAGGTVMLATAGIKAIVTAIGIAGSGAAAGTGLVGALAGVLGPIGLVVAALGTLAAIAYAFKPISKGEVAAVHPGAVGLTPEAAARARALGMPDPWDVATGGSGIGPKSSFLTPGRARSAAAAMGMAPPAAGIGSDGRPVQLVLPDGRVLAEVVTKEQSIMLRRQPTGARGFDPTMSPVSSGYSLSGAL